MRLNILNFELSGCIILYYVLTFQRSLDKIPSGGVYTFCSASLFEVALRGFQISNLKSGFWLLDSGSHSLQAIAWFCFSAGVQSKRLAHFPALWKVTRDTFSPQMGLLNGSPGSRNGSINPLLPLSPLSMS